MFVIPDSQTLKCPQKGLLGLPKTELPGELHQFEECMSQLFDLAKVPRQTTLNATLGAVSSRHDSHHCHYHILLLSGYYPVTIQLHSCLD